MVDWGTLCWLLLLVIVSTLTVWKFKRSSSPLSRLPLPPGPPPLPIIGNMLDIPTKNMPQIFRDFNVKYGELVYLDACGQPMVVLGTHKAAVDLLEKRSANYSNRPSSCMSELSGWSWLMTIMQYGPVWRRTRRIFHEQINSNTISKYHPAQDLETRRYLLRVLEKPQDFFHHGRRLFGAISIRVGYGIDVDKSDVDYLDIADKALETFSLAFIPGKYLVETFPILRHLPLSFPGASFKREAAGWYPIVQKMRDAPWEAAMAAIHNGRNVQSIASNLAERMSHMEAAEAAEEEDITKDAVAAAYAGGADTTFSTLQTFYLAMATHPEVQKLAQAELDSVVGPHRLPTMDDMNNLPYVNAVIRECLRWRPVAPLNFVHVSLREDEYNGFRIPEGTSVIANLWAYTRNATHYPDPESFKPERFLSDGRLNPDVMDPRTVIFGYGRRGCPGRLLAEASMFTVISAVLHTLSIAPPLDEHGRPVRLIDAVKMSHGVVTYPEPFECIIKPRTAEADALIRASCSEDDDAGL